MVDNYKKNILNYITGTLSLKSGNNTPLIAQITEKNINIEEILTQYIDDLESYSVDFSLMRGDYILFFISTSEKNSLTYIWKGSYILIFDKEYNFIKFLDSYDSGTRFLKFTVCYYNELGNIYLIDSEMENTESGSVVKRNRLCILNDFTIKGFKVKLLSSYNVPDYNNYHIILHQLIKNENEGKYFLVYSYKNNNSSYGGALEFVNNVGSENEWNFYPYNGSKVINWNGYMRGEPKWIDNELKFKIFCDFNVSSYNGNTIKFLVLENGENSSIETKTLSLPDTVKNANQMTECQLLNNLAYIETDTNFSDLVKTKAIIQYDLNDNNNKLLYYKDDYVHQSDDNFIYLDDDEIKLFSINNIFFFFKKYRYYKMDKQTFELENIKSDLLLYEFINDDLHEFYIRNMCDITNGDYLLNVFRNYNLYTINSIFPNFILTVKQIYNFANYNGEPYTSVGSLIPNSAILYSANDIVFARNLYNKTLNGNATVSTVEIPNTHLNLIDLTSKKLISETNSMLQEDNKIFQKNIYETVFLNFINSIQMMDKNNNNSIVNNIANVYLNNAINNENEYANAKFCKKVRVIYNDGSTKEVAYELKRETEQAANISFMICVDKYINVAQIISNDKNVIYQTIDLSSLEINKTYRISQKLEVI